MSLKIFLFWKTKAVYTFHKNDRMYMTVSCMNLKCRL